MVDIGDLSPKSRITIMFSGVGMASRMLIALSQLAPVISGVQITLMAMVSNSVNSSLVCCMTSRELSVSSQDTTGIR